MKQVNQEATHSDLAEALRIIMSYMNGKGQLPRLDILILVKLGVESLSYLYKFEPKELVDFNELIALSIHAPTIYRPLWLEAVHEITKINTKTEIVTELKKRKPLE